uniref:DNA topoisomerase II binding protein 1 n=1 Tax=Eptatretus burgeri TaxID=7764 RepID=A0A8C4Q3B7_EPTBU
MKRYGGIIHLRKEMKGDSWHHLSNMTDLNGESHDELFVKFVKVDTVQSIFFKQAQEAIVAGQSQDLLQEVHEVVVLQMKSDDKSLYVCDNFSGLAFAHLRKLGCRIVGPRVVLFCLDKQQCVPKAEHPVHNMSFAGIVVSCTNLGKEAREEMHRLVQLMGGRVLGDFTKAVTHLVAATVGSKKYYVATNLKIPVMLPSWVTACWEASQSRVVCSIDDSLAQYACPPLNGCVVCVTGLSSEERSQVRNIAMDNGGIYSGELKMNECTHLIAHAAKGTKYEFANKWNIACVTIRWLHDSVERGACQDETLYRIEAEQPGLSSGPNTSTPQGNDIISASVLSNVSNIANMTLEHVNCTSRTAGNRVSPLIELDQLDLGRGYVHESLLDGCKIFLAGVGGQRLEQLRRLVNTCGGIRFNHFSDDVTHVVAVNLDAELAQVFMKVSSRPNVVTVKWLIDCFTQGKLLPADDYLHPDYTQLDDTSLPDSSIRQTNTNSAELGQDTLISCFKPKNAEKNAGTTGAAAQLRTNEALLMEYMEPSEEAGVADMTSNLLTRHSPFCQADENVTGKSLFLHKSFKLVGFSGEDRADLASLVEEHGGKTLPLNSDGIADFTIVPLLGCGVKCTAFEVVTNTWLYSCVEEKQLLDVGSSPLFSPVLVAEGSLPLASCVLSISQFVGVERDAVICLANALGAKVQEFFVRKANPKNEMLASTHLLISEPHGSKYEAAVKWGLPAVGRSWLLESARTGCKADEKKHFVRFDPHNNSHRMDIEVTSQASVACLPQAKLPVTPLDPNQFRSKTFQNVLLQERCAARAELAQCTDQDGLAARPSGKSRESSLQLDTPSKFLSRDRLFKPSFDVKDALEALQSPAGGKAAVSVSTPLSELFQRNMRVALVKSSHHPDAATSASPQLPNIHAVKVEKCDVLAGVVICVSKKLNKKQVELHKLAHSLGANTRSTFDSRVTHYIHQGRSNDTTQEYKAVKERGIHIVSDFWLHACAQEKSHVLESLYPFTYNPNLNLNISAVRTRSVYPSQGPMDAQVRLKENDNCNTPEVQANSEGSKNGSSEDSNPKKDLRKHHAEALAALEVRESFQRQIQEVMTATLADRSSTGRRSNASPLASEVVGPRTSRLGSLRRSRTWENIGNKLSEVHSEHSQSEQIVWDDPTAREERARLAKKLHVNCSQGEHEPSSSSLPQQERPSTEHSAKSSPAIDGALTANRDSSPMACRITHHASESSVATPVPSAPCVTLPRANPPATFASEQQIVNGDGPGKEDTVMLQKKFQLSSMSPQDKIDYSQLIEEVGGLVLDKQYFDPDCTHIVVGVPLRNEKYLAAMASGKWVLHKSYLEACRVSGNFVQEEDYEWGSRSILDALSNLNPQQRRLAVAAQRWRIKLQDLRQQEPASKVGAFSGWKVILCIEQGKEAGFKRLLQSGGAKVFTACLTQTYVEATHLFADMLQLKGDDGQLILQEAASHRVLCLRPEFIADFLIMDSAPSEQQYFLPESLSYQQNTHAENEGLSVRKRKGALSAFNKKRSRHV